MVDLLLRDTPIFVSRIYIKMLVNPRFESPQTKTKVKDKIWNTCFKKSTLRSERQKDLLFKAAERHWDEQFAGQGIVGRKVDCYIYKCILYQLEIRQVFLDATLSLKKLSELVDTNQTYLSNVVNKYFGCNLKELLNTYRVEYAKELLRSNKCSLDKVPEKSGFTSRSAFYSAFSKIAGESPKRYFLHEQRDLCAQSITNMYNQF